MNTTRYCPACHNPVRELHPGTFLRTYDCKTCENILLYENTDDYPGQAQQCECAGCAEKKNLLLLLPRASRFDMPGKTKEKENYETKIG